jgi:DNA-directed RNA polymerase subunit RPC12/RpoP
VIVKCDCQRCGRAIEFEVAQLKRVSETPDRTLGQNIDCPHCGSSTQLSLPRLDNDPPTGPAVGSPQNEKRNKFQIAAIWCWSIGGVLVVVPTMTILTVGDFVSDSNIQLWLAHLSLAGLIVGALVMVAGGILQKVGSNRRRQN